MKYFIYCRKSSEQEDRQTLSLPAQIAEITKIARENHLQIVDTFQESKSAHTAGRPQFDEMLRRIEKGEANGILVWDESRLARNSLDGGKLIYMIDLEQIVEIRKPSKTYRNTPDDKSWLQMCFMMSKKDSDDKGVNIKRGMRTKAQQGWYPSSWTKPGYMWDRMAERGNKTLLSDPVRFPLIKKCWDLMITGGYTVPQILRKLNEEWGYRTPVRKGTGGKPMKKSQFYKMFGDPFYYGWYEYKNIDGEKQWYQGSHTPMITEEEFNRVQILLGRSGKQRIRKHEFPLTGIIRCGECNAMVTAEEKWQIICSSCKYKFSSQNKSECPKCHILISEMDTPKILHYTYYHCTKRINPQCTQKSVVAEELEAQISEILGHIQISERFKNWAIKYLNALNDEEVVSHTAAINSLQNAYNDCIKRLDNLVKLKISPQNSDSSLLSDSEFKSQKTAITAEKDKLEQQLGIQGQRVDSWVASAEKHFDFAIHARYKWQQAWPEEKRRFIATHNTLIYFFLKDLAKKFFFLEVIKHIKTQIETISDKRFKSAICCAPAKYPSKTRRKDPII